MGVCFGKSRVAPAKSDPPTTAPNTASQATQNTEAPKPAIEAPKTNAAVSTPSVNAAPEKSNNANQTQRSDANQSQSQSQSQSIKTETLPLSGKQENAEAQSNSKPAAPVKEGSISRKIVEFKEATPNAADEAEEKKATHKDSPQIVPALKKPAVIPPIVKDSSKSLSKEAAPDVKKVASTSTAPDKKEAADDDIEDSFGEMKESAKEQMHFRKHKNSISILKKDPLVLVPKSSSQLSIDETESESSRSGEHGSDDESEQSAIHPNKHKMFGSVVDVEKSLTRAETVKKLETKLALRSTKKDLLDRNILKGEEMTAAQYEQQQNKFIKDIMVKLEFHLVSRPDIQTLVETNIAQELDEIEEKTKSKELKNKAIGRLAKEALIEKKILSREVTADLAVLEQDMIRNRLMKSPRPYDEPMTAPSLFVPDGDGSTGGSSINLARTFTKEELMQQSILTSEESTLSSSGPRILSRKSSLQWQEPASRAPSLADAFAPLSGGNSPAAGSSSPPGESLFPKRRLSRLGPMISSEPAFPVPSIVMSAPPIGNIPPSALMSEGALPSASRRASFVPVVSSPLVSSASSMQLAKGKIEENDEYDSSDDDDEDDDEENDDGNEEEEEKEKEKRK